jgi:two-component system, cell cycle sensor histidine kinase and response regulator CckA
MELLRKNGGDYLMADVLTTNSASGPELPDLRAVLPTQKTLLIGELAGAMSNQLNNIMMAISSYAELELKKAPPKGKRSLEQVLSNAARATFLIQKLLAFSRKTAPSPQPLELNKAITEISDLVQQILGERIEFTLRLDERVERIEADSVELEQLVLSLVLSARDAMPAGGKLTLSTESVKLNKEFIGADENVLPGKYAMLSICDAAPRHVAAEAASGANRDLRINLALATVRRVAEEAHGLLRVFSDAAKGTTFNIYFPAISTESAEQPEYVSPMNAPAAKTILVVEDDDAVRVPASEFLMMEGFKVLQARTGAEAIRVAQQNRSPLDLLVTDIVMPGMDGRDVAAQLLEMCPDLKVLYMSGDAHQAASANRTQASQSLVLQKPFRLNTLKDKIREILG